MRTIIFAVLLAPTLTPALAQEVSSTDDAPAAEQEPQYKDLTEIDFDEVDVRGELVRPKSMLFQELTGLEFPPLAKIRDDFRTETAESVHLIK